MSLLISTLLLVVMVVAGAALIYAYMVGFIGGTTHVPASIQITGFCASASSRCGGTIYTVSIDNIGTSPINGAFSLSFSDSTSSLGVATASCANVALGAGATLVCAASVSAWTSIGLTATPTPGDQITVTAVSADGGTAITFTKSLT